MSDDKIVVISANTSWYLFNFRKNTISKLLQLGFVVVVVAPTDEYSDRLQELGCLVYNIQIDQGGTNPFKDFFTFVSFYKLYRRIHPSVVLNFTPKNNIYSSFAAMLLNIPYINNIAGLGSVFIKNNIISLIAKCLYKFSQRNASLIFFQNESDKKLFIDYGIADGVLIDLLPGSGVDLNRFSPSNRNNDGVVKFLLVSRMLIEKGVEIYVQAAKDLSEKYGKSVSFSLLGFLDCNNPSSVTSEQMELWVKSGFVEYLGVSDTTEDVIKNFDCVVLPSYYREGVPKSLLEAAAMAKPLVTTDNVGCRDTVINGVNGYLCEMKSVESLKKSIELIINNTYEQRLVMGSESRKLVERQFDENIVINKYLNAITSLV